MRNERGEVAKGRSGGKERWEERKRKGEMNLEGKGMKLGGENESGYESEEMKGEEKGI